METVDFGKSWNWHIGDNKSGFYVLGQDAICCITTAWCRNPTECKPSLVRHGLLADTIMWIAEISSALGTVYLYVKSAQNSKRLWRSVLPFSTTEKRVLWFLHRLIMLLEAYSARFSWSVFLPCTSFLPLIQIESRRESRMLRFGICIYAHVYSTFVHLHYPTFLFLLKSFRVDAFYSLFVVRLNFRLQWVNNALADWFSSFVRL